VVACMYEEEEGGASFTGTRWFLRKNKKRNQVRHQSYHITHANQKSIPALAVMMEPKRCVFFLIQKSSKRLNQTPLFYCSLNSDIQRFLLCLQKTQPVLNAHGSKIVFTKNERRNERQRQREREGKFVTLTNNTIYNLAFWSPLHPASCAIISAAFSPIANTVNMGLILVIVGKTPASAILTPRSPLTFNS